MPQLRQLQRHRREVEAVVHILLCGMSSLLFPFDLSTNRRGQPVVPLSIHGYEDVTCSICRFAQPLENRQDVQQMKGSGGQGMALQPQGPYPPQGGPPQGWGGSPVNGPPGSNKPMQYG